MKLNFRIIFVIHCPTLISSSCFRKIMSRLSIATVRCIHHTWRLWWISCEINSRGSQCAKSRYLDRGHYLHVVTRPTRIALVKRIRDDLGINQATYSLSGSLAENFSLFRESSTASLTLRQTIRRANLVDFAKHQNTPVSSWEDNARLSRRCPEFTRRPCCYCATLNYAVDRVTRHVNKVRVICSK